MVEPAVKATTASNATLTPKPTIPSRRSKTRASFSVRLLFLPIVGNLLKNRNAKAPLPSTDVTDGMDAKGSICTLTCMGRAHHRPYA